MHQSKLFCSVCSGELGRELIGCSRRKQDACPYTVAKKETNIYKDNPNSDIKNQRNLIILGCAVFWLLTLAFSPLIIFFLESSDVIPSQLVDVVSFTRILIIAVFPVVAMLIGTKYWFFPQALAVFFIAASFAFPIIFITSYCAPFLFILGGLVAFFYLFRSHVTLTDTETNTLWEGYFVGNFLLQAYLGTMDVIDFTVKVPESLTYPTSITSLPGKVDMPTAQTPAAKLKVLEKTILNLVLRNVLLVYVAKKSFLKNGQPVQTSKQKKSYLIGLSPETDLNHINGALEKALVAVFKNNPSTLKPIYDMVCALFDKQKKDPDFWISSFPRREAISVGLGRNLTSEELHLVKIPSFMIKLIADRIEELPFMIINPKYKTEFDKQQALNQSLYNQVAQNKPGFIKILEKETRRAIRNRTLPNQSRRGGQFQWTFDD